MLASILKVLFEAVKMWFACLAGRDATADGVAHFGAWECDTLSPLEQRAGIVLLTMLENIMAETWDVFISYARADQDWTRTLATNLHNLGLDIFFDEWEIGPGDVLVHRLDEGLLRSRDGVLVVSPTALARPWVQNEYAAMMTRAVEGQQRLIPVLLADAAMPPLLASRVWIDFRHTDGPVYAEKVLELARALRGERPGPPLRLDQVQPPPGTGFRTEGPMHYRLQVDRHTVHLLGRPEAVQQPARALP